MNSEGYIAVVNEIITDHYDDILEGSPVFQLKNDEIIPIQKFSRSRQNRVRFIKYHGLLLMLQTFCSGENPNEKSHCPILKWTESTTFIEVDHIPCINAIQVEPFLIDDQIYVAVANYMDARQNIETHSMIFHYDAHTHKLNLTQKIKTYGAIDIKHVHINDHHFLIVANSFRAQKFGSARDKAITSNAVVYQYEHSKFVPVQIIPFDAEISQFLPYFVRFSRISNEQFFYIE